MKFNNISFCLLCIISLILTTCSEDSFDIDGNEGDNTGKGGSMARFAVTGNQLYTVDNSTLKTFDITNSKNPKSKNNIQVDFGLETIFPYKDKLFLGSQFGMHVYDIGTTPFKPERLSYFEHVTACDPVVADGDYAYVTLSSESWCGRTTNELQIINISDINKPELETQYAMDKPKGLGIDGDTLFVCDNGLKVYDASNVMNLDLIKHFEDIEAYDVIPYKGNLIVTGSDGIRQYDYSNKQITLLSKLLVTDE